MELTITPKAMDWFKREIVLEQGMGVQFFGKVYGKTDVHEGFSVGLSVATPEETMTTVTKEGYVFFIDKADDWFFKGYDLTVDYDDTLDEPMYRFTETAKN